MAATALKLAGRRGHVAAFVATTWGTDILVTPARSPIHKTLALNALRRADLVTGDSHDMRDAVMALAPNSRWHTFIFGPERRILDSPRIAEKTLISARRLEPEMRIELVVEGFREARRRHPKEMAGVRLIIAGDGASAATIRQFAADVPDVEFAGQLDRHELEETMLHGAALISIPTSDGTSAALLEGMAAGLVPVVNDLPANREWVDETIGEVLSRDPSAVELGEAIVRAIGRTGTGASIRARVAMHTWEAECDILASVFQTLPPYPVGGKG